MRVLRTELTKLIEEIRKLKFGYFIVYEVQYLNNWNDQIGRQIFHETIFLDKDIKIDFPDKTDTNFITDEISTLFLNILSLLKNTYDEVSLLKVRRL